MGREIWLYIREQLAALTAMLGRGLVALWRLGVGSARDIGWRRWRMVLLAVPLLFFVYIGIGMALVQRVDADLAFAPESPEGGARVVATVAGLVHREVRDHNWTPNDPIFLPGWWIDNTPHFQRGMMGALSRFTIELRDQLGRMRGSSAVDPDLEVAAGNLAREGERWIWDLSTSFLPTTPSDVYFREGARQLDAYNARLVTGDAVFERRSDNLLATMDRIALDLGASSAALDAYIRDHAGGFGIDYGSDNLFFQVKGQVYAYLLIIDALETDFTEVVRARELAPLFVELKSSLRQSVSLAPTYVANGTQDGLLNNHLAIQGFYLLRARTQLREITNILLK